MLRPTAGSFFGSVFVGTKMEQFGSLLKEHFKVLLFGMIKVMKTKNIIRIMVGTALILMVPLVAMQFSEEVDWKLGDFVIIGTLLISAGLAYELVSSKVNKKYCLVIAAIIGAAVLLIWAELAVGIFGSPFAGS